MNYELGVSHVLVIKSSRQSQSEFQILTQKYRLLIERPFFRKDHFVFFLKTKKSKKAHSQNEFRLPVYNSIESVHLGLSLI